MDSLPFNFGPGGYTAPDFSAPFESRDRGLVSSSAYLQSAINAISPQEDFLKYCPTYVIGYGQSIQIIKGRCVYGGLRDIAGLIEGIKKQGQGDLGGEIIAELGFISDQKDLPAYIESWYEAFLSGSIFTKQAGTEDLPALLQGFEERDLPAQINQIWSKDLPAQMRGVGPVDLPAYLKVWPERPLPASIYGWGGADLGGQINQIWTKDLGAILRPYKWDNLKGILRAWGQGQEDLPTTIGVVYFSDLPGSIQATAIKDLIGIISPIPPKELSANIFGWHQVDLAATLIVDEWKYDLSANITPTGGYKDLPAYLKTLRGSGTGNLSATITYYLTRDLGSYIYGKTYSDLSASVDTKRLVANLSASIYPKTVRMTAVILAHTMAHRDLDAFINACFYSQSVNLPAYLRVVYKSDLWATIHGKVVGHQQKDLSATIGYGSFYFSVDKLNLVINIREGTYIIEDKLPIYIRYFDQMSDLYASVTGVLTSSDLNASLTGIYLQPYNFEGVGTRIKHVGKLTYNGLIENSQIVEFKFEQIVMDYFYVNGEQQLYKHNSIAYRNFTMGIDRWLLALESFYPANELMGLKRRLHKATSLFNLKDFDSIDAAVRHAIDYVITDFHKDMPALINVSGGKKELSALLNPRVRDYSNLGSQINAI